MTDLGNESCCGHTGGHGRRHDGAVTTEAVQTSTLITEHEVLIGSTAALTAPSVRRRGFGTVVRALFTTTEKADRPEKRSTPRRYPKHYEFIETAAMSREDVPVVSSQLARRSGVTTAEYADASPVTTQL